MRKTLIFLLVAALSLSLGAATLSAAGDIAPAAYSDIAGHEAEGDLTLLAAMGYVPHGAALGGAINPDGTLTRAQFCKLVIQILGRDTTALGLMGLAPTFGDGASIPTWAWGYVNAAVYMGLLNGYADETFGADRPISYAEAVTVLVRGVPGHLAQLPTGVWPYNYLFYGVDAGFTGSVEVGFASLPASCGDLARLLVATMQVPKLDKDGQLIADSAILFDRAYTEGEGEEEEAHHVGRLWHGLFYWMAGEPFAISYPALGHWFLCDPSDPVYLVGATGYGNASGLPVRAVTDADGEVIFLDVDEETSVVTGVLKELADTNDVEGPDTIVLVDGTRVPYDEEGEDPETWVPTTMNRFSPVPLGVLGEILELGEGLLPPELVITLDPDGKAANVVATIFTTALWIDEFTKSAVLPDGTKQDTGLELWDLDETVFVPATCQVMLNGALSDRDSLAEYDAVSLAFDFSVMVAPEETPPPYIIRAHREAIEGTVTTTTVTYPGEVHRATVDLKEGGSETYLVNEDGGIGADFDYPATGAVVKYGLDFDGRIFVPIGYEPLTPFVYVRSFSLNGDGSATATVDVRGQDVTYKVANATNGEMTLFDFMLLSVESFCWIEVDTARGMIVDAAYLIGDFSPWFILANTQGALTLGDDPVEPLAFHFVPAEAGLTVYQVDLETMEVTYAEASSLPLTDGDSLMLGILPTTSLGFDGLEPDAVEGGLLWLWLPEMPIT